MRSPIHKSLFVKDSPFRQRVVKNKKGGKYTRKIKHRQREN